ncbi:hypothetical protein BCR39DRAFT_524449 [Naematelia encephala]|uniref:Methyltransferase type 11 domain-containing protein n=1 Tax=Naematelia encephala TaxID=71784 RepID=A0A1Y2BCA8_9TREE|nr:hypothetical protein BCR39DRAFT_524449 [Naematelia encephala]
MPKPVPTPYIPPSTDPSIAEQSTVHDVYEAIAPHFSQTRHKPWPLIDRFLSSQPPLSLGLDSGAGNGKYLVTAGSYGLDLIALDRSAGLLDIARRQSGRKGVNGDEALWECVRADLGFKGWRQGVFDFAISIAAIHHLSTPLRRQEAVQALLQPLRHSSKRPYARFMIYVWAYEQGAASRRKMGAVAVVPDGQTESAEVDKVQDVLVPWVLQAQEGQTESQVFQRYYHLFVAGELRDLVSSAAEAEGYRVLQGDDRSGGCLRGTDKWLRIRAEGWEADNWWIEGEVGLGEVDRQDERTPVEADGNGQG